MFRITEPSRKRRAQCGPPQSPCATADSVRHVVLGLTIAAYAITYMDRVVISSAVPAIQKEFGFSLITMGWILSSFQWAYALFRYQADGLATGWVRGEH